MQEKALKGDTVHPPEVPNISHIQTPVKVPDFRIVCTTELVTVRGWRLQITRDVFLYLSRENAINQNSGIIISVRLEVQNELGQGINASLSPTVLTGTFIDNNESASVS